MKQLRCFALFFVMYGTLASAQTYTVEGLIFEGQSAAKSLKLPTGLTLPVIATNDQTEKELSRIGNGDFLFGIGKIDHSNNQIKLHSIEKVGLKKLLGHWKSDQGSVFVFKNFNQLTLFNKALQSPSEPEDVLNLRYHVAPSAGSTWSIYLLGATDVVVGRFRFFEDRLSMYFIDQTTGEVTLRLKLTKIHNLRQ